MECCGWSGLPASPMLATGYWIPYRAVSIDRGICNIDCARLFYHELRASGTEPVPVQRLMVSPTNQLINLSVHSPTDPLPELLRAGVANFFIIKLSNANASIRISFYLRIALHCISY